MIFTRGLSVPEGPVLLDDGSFLVVEMGPSRGSVTRLSADGRVGNVVARTGRPNGLAVDARGNIWVAESEDPALLCLSPMGVELGRVTEDAGGSPFVFPNDLAFGRDGNLYLTDSGVAFGDFAPGGRVREDWRDVRPDGRVYRIEMPSLMVRKVDDGILFTNGIAFGPDDDLYINETLTGEVFRYAWNGGEVGPRHSFGNVLVAREREQISGPDGMKFSVDGRLFVTVFGQGDVTVLGTDGQVLERIATAGAAPTNLVFGPAGSGVIYVTEDAHGTLERLGVGVDGLTLHKGSVVSLPRWDGSDTVSS